MDFTPAPLQGLLYGNVGEEVVGEMETENGDISFRHCDLTFNPIHATTHWSWCWGKLLSFKMSATVALTEEIFGRSSNWFRNVPTLVKVPQYGLYQLIHEADWEADCLSRFGSLQVVRKVVWISPYPLLMEIKPNPVTFARQGRQKNLPGVNETLLPSQAISYKMLVLFKFERNATKIKMISAGILKSILPLALLSIITPILASAPNYSSDFSEYEYVIIGSGAGGGTVAANLARKGHSVFLIEAGGDYGSSPHQEIPGLVFLAGEDPEMSWSFYVRHYRNETQARRDSKFTYRLPNGSLYYGLDPPSDAQPLGTLYPRGATLGGSTQINAMCYIKARDDDWNYVAELTGNDSWSAKAMEHYFLALENCHYVPDGTPGHGFDGFISANQNNITYVTDRPSTVNIMSNLANDIERMPINGSQDLGELMQRDVNGANAYVPGVYQLVVSTTETRRRSGSRDYLVDTASAKTSNGSAKYRLTISTHSFATRVLFEDGVDMPRANGVEYMLGEGLYGADSRYNPAQNGTLRRVTASREVIVAGGAFNTPQILKLSGVGPREELESFGIPVVVDLPAVGKYLQDHSEGMVIVNASVPWENDPNSRCTFTLDAMDSCYQEWETKGTGPYGEAAAPLGLIYRSSVNETEAADLFFFGWPSTLSRGFYPGYSNGAPAPTSWTWDIIKLHMPGDGNHAQGTVTLRSSDPRDVPEIVFDWLQGEVGQRDLTALVEAAELAYRGWALAPEPYSPVRRVQPAEGADVRQNIMDEAFGHHASSSCRMGPKGNPEYCVDPDLRVNGVQNLRIVDASVFPHTPGAFPALSVYMLGLKAADMISADARPQ